MVVRIGLIGAGGISGAHVAALNETDDAQIVAVCDIDRDRANQRAKEAKAEVVCTDFREMFDRTPLDAIWLCTPPDVRSGPIEAAIERKIPVFTEKPAGNDLEQSRELADRIDRSGVPVMVGYLLRYMKSADRVKAKLEKDRLSLICSTYCCPLTLSYQQGSRSWFYDKGRSGGAIMDQATHSIDLMRYLVGEIETVYALGSNCIQPKCEDYTVEDAYGLAFRFDNGAIGIHGHTWCHYAWRHEMTFYGLDGVYRLGCNNNATEFEFQNGKTVEEWEDRPMVNEDRLFVEMVKSGDFSQMRSSFSDAVKTLAVTKRCLEVLDAPDGAASEAR